MKWIIRFIILGVLGYTGYSIYSSHRAGLFNLPEMSDDAYYLSFANGLRGIVQGLEVAEPINADSPAILRRLSAANPDRRYIGVPMEVAPWFEDVWSACAPPTDDERTYVETNMPAEWKIKLQGARFDAMCYIETDDQKRILRGFVYSIPRA